MYSHPDKIFWWLSLDTLRDCIEQFRMWKMLKFFQKSLKIEKRSPFWLLSRYFSHTGCAYVSDGCSEQTHFCGLLSFELKAVFEKRFQIANSSAFCLFFQSCIVCLYVPGWCRATGASRWWGPQRRQGRRAIEKCWACGGIMWMERQNGSS